MPALDVIGNISRVDVSYPDGRRYRFVGGAALHIAQAAAAAGASPRLVSVIGRDLQAVLPKLAQLGVDVANVLVSGSGPSSRFRIRYDEHDDVVSVDSAHGAAGGLTAHALAVLSDEPAPERHRHVCCRTPLDAPAVLNASQGETHSIDFFPSSVGRLMSEAAEQLCRASVIFVNDAELQKLRERLDPRDLACVVCTAGSKPSHVYRFGQTTARAQPQPVRTVDVTGAGDAVVGAFLAHHIQGATDRDALEAAVRAGTAATLTPGGLPWIADEPPA